MLFGVAFPNSSVEGNVLHQDALNRRCAPGQRFPQRRLGARQSLFGRRKYRFELRAWKRSHWIGPVQAYR